MRRALRNDWPLRPTVRTSIQQVLANVVHGLPPDFDPANPPLDEDGNPIVPIPPALAERFAAIGEIRGLQSLQLAQESVDLKRRAVRVQEQQLELKRQALEEARRYHDDLLELRRQDLELKRQDLEARRSAKRKDASDFAEAARAARRRAQERKRERGDDDG